MHLEYALRTAVVTLAATLALASHAAAQPPAPPPDPQDAPPAPALVARAFGSVQFGKSQEPGEASSFTLGQFALFMTAPLGEHFSVLAEIVMEGSIDTRVITDLERLQLTYRWNDALQLSAGRYHTGIGFYNATFHHGAYFEIPIGRPQAFAFEDEGGILPVHEVGLTARGTIPNTASSVYYVFEVGNGRRWTPAVDDEDESVRDENDAKSINAGISYRPDGWRGLEAGVSFYRDTIPAPAEHAVRHNIAAAFVTYRTPAVEVMAEWLHLTHRTGDDGPLRSNAGYAQASRAFGRVRPYYRFDRLAIPPEAPFIGPSGSYTAHIAGLRIDPAEWVGIKAQYERKHHQKQHGVDGFRTELVFVF